MRPLQIFQLNSIRLPGTPVASMALTISEYDTPECYQHSRGPPVIYLQDQGYQEGLTKLRYRNAV